MRIADERPGFVAYVLIERGYILMERGKPVEAAVDQTEAVPWRRQSGG